MSNPDDVMDIYVPGNWTCPKCGFTLSKQTLFVGSGEVGYSRDEVMRMEGEFCPNDGEPIHRTTWRERAEENRKWGESLMEDIIAATRTEHLPAALEAVRNNARDIHAYRGALGYAVPGWHDGKLSDGTEPRCGMCDARVQSAHGSRAYPKCPKCQNAVTECSFCYQDGLSVAHGSTTSTEPQTLSMWDDGSCRNCGCASTEHVCPESASHGSAPEAPQREQECPVVADGGDCPCEISTRHQWFIAFCAEREKLKSGSAPEATAEGKKKR